MGGRNDTILYCFQTKPRIGTTFDSKYWLSLDPCGMIGITCSFSVHIFAFYVISKHLVKDSFLANAIFVLFYLPVTILAVISLYRAWTTNPGAIPLGARPLITVKRASSNELLDSPKSSSSRNNNRAIRRCHKCNDNYKAPRAHHDSITGRCIVKFDHYCPWVCNAVGALNHKFFVLFIFYTMCTCILSLLLIVLRAMHCGFAPHPTSGTKDIDDTSVVTTSIDDAATTTTAADNDNDNSSSSDQQQHRHLYNYYQIGSLVLRQLSLEEESTISTSIEQEECIGWHTSITILILLICSIIFLLFTFCMLIEQMEAIETNSSKIARMKMRVGQAGTELSRVTEEFNEMFGGDTPNVTWHWFIPIPIEFPRGMEKVVLGYEWDETFDPIPYNEEDNTTTYNNNSSSISSNNNDIETGLSSSSTTATATTTTPNNNNNTNNTTKNTTITSKIELTRTSSSKKRHGGSSSTTTTRKTMTKDSFCDEAEEESFVGTPVINIMDQNNNNNNNSSSNIDSSTTTIKKKKSNGSKLVKRSNSRGPTTDERLNTSNGTISSSNNSIGGSSTGSGMLT